MFTVILWFIIFIFAIIICSALSILIYKIIFEPKAGICACQTRLDGKIVIVTGGNSGIGFETAKDLAKRGAKVIIADVQNSDKTVDEIVKATGNTEVEYARLDLASFASIKIFTEDIKRRYNHIDILVNNAGIGSINKHFTEDGINTVMQINYFGPFLLTLRLLDTLAASKSSRIVIVASAAHYYAKFDIDDIIGVKETSFSTLYANSKLCNVLWMKALSKRLHKNITVNSVHPGIVKTKIFDNFLLSSVILFVIDIFFKSSEQGAQTSIHLCASSKLEGSSGNHYADCKVKTISRYGRDEELVEKVWTTTTALLEKYLSD
ncbi:retinol dehydrogenase 11-like [Pieris brassicae]|uniref:retinol dehydrogenase 11-like n=1 Tax=Pieris brassicae TaxID=7116 RepID=UPI001E66225F|nr:retinol dehydrogenase 11-like [Pieris brassicae]